MFDMILGRWVFPQREPTPDGPVLNVTMSLDNRVVIVGTVQVFYDPAGNPMHRAVSAYAGETVFHGDRTALVGEHSLRVTAELLHGLDAIDRQMRWGEIQSRAREMRDR